jgi:hypothetical protein
MNANAEACINDSRGEAGLNASVTAQFVGRNGVFALSPVRLWGNGIPWAAMTAGKTVRNM